MVAAQYKVYVPLGTIKGNRYGYYPPRLNAEVLPELTAVRAEFLMLERTFLRWARWPARCWVALAA